ncbi:MAG: hypothetical protein ACTSUE_19915 [Promethearchaeota archaeon]
MMDKLRVLYEGRHYAEALDELLHYLSRLHDHLDSPLVLELLRLLKKVILKDLENLDENLDKVDHLFSLPSLDVQKILLDMVSILSDMKSLRGSLFSRYFTHIERYFMRADSELKAALIDLLIQLSRSDLKNRTLVLEFFLRHYEVFDSLVLPSVNVGMVRIFDEDPGLGVVLKGHVGVLLDRYFFENDPACIKSFLDLFSYLQGFREYFISMGIRWMRSENLKLKEKSLKIFKKMMGTKFYKDGFDLLLENLSVRDIDFQSNVVAVLNDISSNNINYYLSKIMKNYFHKPLSENEKLGYIELLTSIAEGHFNLVFGKVMQYVELDDENTFNLSLNLLKNLDFEFPTQLESSLFAELEGFEHFHWKIKINIIERIWRIIKEIGREILFLWFGMLLQKILTESEWGDDEVIVFTREIFRKLQELEPHLMEKIVRLKDKITYFKKNLTVARNFPRLMREHIDSVRKEGTQRVLSSLLTREYNSFLEKIKYFDNFVDNLEFRHLILDLVDDWIHAKEYIIEDLNVVREYLTESINSCAHYDRKNVEGTIAKLKQKFEILKIEFDDVNLDDSPGSTRNFSRFLQVLIAISNFNTNLAMLDVNINKIFIQYPVIVKDYQDFLDQWNEFRDMTSSRIMKIERSFDAMVQSLVGRDNVLENLEVHQRILQNLFAEYVRKSIVDYKKILLEIEKDNDEFNELIGYGKYYDVEKTLNYKNSKYRDLVEQKTVKIQHYWRSINNLSNDIEFLVNLRRLYDEWDSTRANLIERLNDFFNAMIELIDVEQIKRMLAVVSPVPIESLKKRIKSITYRTDAEYVEGILNLIQKYNIKAQVRDRSLHDFRNLHLEEISSLIKIKNRINVYNNNFTLLLDVKNTSVQDIYDFAISLKIPDNLKLVEEEGNGRRRIIPLLNAGKNLSIQYNIDGRMLPVNKVGTLGMGLFSTRISLIFSGKLHGDRDFHKIKEIEIIYSKEE